MNYFHLLIVTTCLLFAFVTAAKANVIPNGTETDRLTRGGVHISPVVLQEILLLHSELRNLRSEFERYRGLNVAFTARVSPSIESIEPWATIKFSQVDTNIGQGYNPATGVFTAPEDGTYAFYSHILSKVDKIIETVLQVNGQNKMYIYSGGKYHGSGSNMYTTRLTRGDTVKIVKHGPWGTKPFYVHHVWSTFSGFLIHADARPLLFSDGPINAL